MPEATKMAIHTRELHSSFATEVTGLNLSASPGDDDIAAIKTAIDAYPVLVFRDQRLTDAQLHDFAARFGPLEIGRAAARPGRRRLPIPQIGDIPTSMKTTESGRPTIANGWIVLAIGCGTRMPPTCRFRLCWDCCMP
jgi:alpha-ketoglutarate-dependent taurine dioxygenase